MHLLVLGMIHLLLLLVIVVLFLNSQLSHYHQALKIMSILHITLMLHHLMNLNVILQIIASDILVQNAGNW